MANAEATSASPAPEPGVSQTTLAVDRTGLAHERTMMAWVRTGTSLISFGFSIYKFFELRVEDGVAQAGGLLNTRVFGFLMISVGLAALAIATFQHVQAVRRLRALGMPVPRSLTAVLGALVAALGVLGLLAVIFRQ